MLSLHVKMNDEELKILKSTQGTERSIPLNLLFVSSRYLKRFKILISMKGLWMGSIFSWKCAQHPSRNRVYRASEWAIRMEIGNDQKLPFSLSEDISRTGGRIGINEEAFQKAKFHASDDRSLVDRK